jgi:hypothetical protein
MNGLDFDLIDGRMEQSQLFDGQRMSNSSGSPSCFRQKCLKFFLCIPFLGNQIMFNGCPKRKNGSEWNPSMNAILDPL